MDAPNRLRSVRTGRPSHYAQLIHDLDCRRNRTVAHFQISLAGSADLIRLALIKIEGRRRHDRLTQDSETRRLLREAANG